MKQAILLSIRLYQKYLSLDTGWLRTLFPTAAVCRYSPTCSQYLFEAISRYGIIKGLFLGVRRLLRCHPWNLGGVDPLPQN